MGEYAKIKGTGANVKIGTCEDMYYLRADQAHRVWPQHGNVDPIKDAGEIRFRFPWPDEDRTEPGEFADPFRSMALSIPAPVSFNHSSIQFTRNYPHQGGMNVSLPCPDGPDGLPGVTIHRNGYAGEVRIVQQRAWVGRLVLVCACGSCGAKYRLETLELAEPVLVALRSMADRENAVAERNNTPGNAEVAARYHEIADRITAGYVDPPAFVAALVTA